MNLVYQKKDQFGCLKVILTSDMNGWDIIWEDDCDVFYSCQGKREILNYLLAGLNIQLLFS